MRSSTAPGTPAIIVLVSDGERALLGRQASWPARRFPRRGFVERAELGAVAAEARKGPGVEVLEREFPPRGVRPPRLLVFGFRANPEPREQGARGR